MNKALITTLIVIAVLALAGGLFFFGSLYRRSQAFGFPGMMTLARGASAGVGGAGGHGGMMGGRGGYGGMMGGYSGMVNGRGGMMGGP
ncbi:MAG TPA: hypothetical protein VKP68_17945, partial [Ramlibacter sp.]|nr:hypothetical protein [Ramlibacter sp.]